MEAYIPRSNIIKELGGDDDWEYKYIEPLPNENDPIRDTVRRATLQATRDRLVKEYEELTRTWLTAGEDGGVKDKRKAIAKKLEEGYWEMDKHLRARTVYDRMGVLQPNGKVDFYNYRKKGVETSEDDID
jgi:hypothetical protein